MSWPSAQLLYRRGFLFLIASDRVPVGGYITLSTFPSTFLKLELSKPITRWYAHMADTVLTELSATSLFDLSGVVAVVTGGGTVSYDDTFSVSLGGLPRFFRALG